jgi:hypothetical protein
MAMSALFIVTTSIIAVKVSNVTNQERDHQAW